MEFDIQRDMVGAVIGKGGGTARSIRSRTGASVHVHSPQNENARVFVELRGRREQIESAFEELRGVVASVDADYAKQMQAVVTLKTKPESVGCLIGKQGQNIKQIEEETRARVRVEPHEEGEEFQCVHVSGEVAAVEMATQMVQDSLDRYDATRSKKQPFSPHGPRMPPKPTEAQPPPPEIPPMQTEQEAPAPPILIQAPTGGFGPHPAILVLQADGTYHPAQIVTAVDGGFNAAGVFAIAQPPAPAVQNYFPQSQQLDVTSQRMPQTVYPQQNLMGQALMTSATSGAVMAPGVNFQQFPPQLYNLTASMPMATAIGLTSTGTEQAHTASIPMLNTMTPSSNYPPPAN